jgi:hypothetical protein
MTKPISHGRGDRAGQFVALLCCVHCIAGPTLLTFAGLSSLIDISERAEVLFLCASAAIGTAVLVPAYRRRHRRLSCLLMFGAGIAALLARRHLSGHVETATTLIAASLIVGGHLLNIRYSKRCECCAPTSQVRIQIAIPAARATEPD